jgi:tetratricopeptide (TPR) repeat protein
MQAEQRERLNAALAGRYVLERELGRGGMATVYLGRDLKHRRDVALKVFRPELAALLGADRFRREIELAANLSHPHILPLHDSGEAGGFLFYVMPYITGETLRQVLERERQLPVERAVELTRQVASALEYAHAHRVLHRDIKPENILLHEGEAMVADFGIALAMRDASGERLTEIGLALGTPEYMSPEQAVGERELDARSDDARAAATTALALDPSLGESHTVFGTLKVVCDFDWAGAEREFQRALELNPNSADTYDLYGRVCSSLGRFEESIAMERRAQELDPLAHRSDFATSLLRAGRYEEALREAERAVEFEPLYDRAHATIGWAYLRIGRADEGIAELERAAALSPDDTAWLGQLGEAYAEAGRTAQAREVLARLTEMSTRRYVSPYHMAYVYTGLGEDDRAIDWLERAYEERAGAVYGIRGSFLFTRLRSHPRFVALLRRMNLA